MVAQAMTTKPDLGLLRRLSAEEERAMWAARLAAQTPEERLQTAQEHWLYIGAYGYCTETGRSLVNRRRFSWF